MDTIKSSEEVSRLFNEGKRVNTPDITFIALRNDELHDRKGRVAFIAGKKQGNAVWRNRAKRRMRAVCADLNGPFVGYDVIFLARSSISKSSYSKIIDNSKRALDKAGIR